MKKVISIILVVMLFGAMFVGCSQEEDAKTDDKQPAQTEKTSEVSEKETESEKAEKVTLQFWQKNFGDAHSIFDETIAEFTSQNPNVTIEAEIIPNNTISEKVRIAATVNELPNLQTATNNWVLSYAHIGILESLDDILDPSLYDSGFIEAFKVGGELRMLPMYAVPLGLAVNVDMVEEAGMLDLLPQDTTTTWTWDDALKILRAVSKPEEEKYGFGVQGLDTGGDQEHALIMKSFGGAMFRDGKCVADDPNSIKALSLYKQMIDEGLVPEGFIGTGGGQLVGTLFPSGKLCMVFANPGHISGSIKAKWNEGVYPEFNMRWVQYPSVDGKNSATAVFPTGLCVWKSDNKAETKWAKKYAQFLVSAENLKAMYDLSPNLIIPSEKVAELYEPDSYAEQSMELFKYPVNWGYDIAAYAEYRKILLEEMQALFTGVKTPEETGKSLAERANKVIEEAQ